MSEFLHMGGYAAYVWSSYGLALVVYGAVYFMPKMAHKRILRALKGRYKREDQAQK
jgi:heme exporter protein D